MHTVSIALNCQITWTFAFKDLAKALVIRDAILQPNGAAVLSVADDFGQQAEIKIESGVGCLVVSLDQRDAIMVDQYTRDMRARMQAERLAMSGSGNSLMYPSGAPRI